ncbi:flavin-containing monooxygenase [Candidatus Lucifugimonas marina]|uniref:FAD-dependent oxidoreductase n=1 Tax=Candidatus Lucifugimonas marina TaxID=3038979 RepID=A0AAJ5ZFQ1_9CHLR|nr:FAD-dependent oxidoreductase [SAR202 cluster bacterium JH702]MDG0869250.1 FAD-dependent oxidoreductase [SAR202 cluster bacterium JH639]WFG36653.1 FAD-dependent oxidoreductase [SAR202 cluster bacterium JH545]WFG40587.1 FAD-dependent oxidoreductase [SAR202 cluster bacterium JH1073]
MTVTSGGSESTNRTDIEEFDVLVVGAGIAGVGGAYHLSTQRPDSTFVVLESQDNFGGTWRSHNYPGIRSDSDLHTYGYKFKPWTGPPIATAEEILNYMGEVIDENDLSGHIRYNHKITSAKWSSEENRWFIEATQTDTGDSRYFSANFLWMCQGYYRHSEGFTPDWPGMDDYQGQIVHSETWPKDLDYVDKKVIVVGSGATSATLIPAIADSCEHVTLVQRSPIYYGTGRNQNELADMLREIEVDDEWIHEIVRRKIIHDQSIFHRRTFEEPEVVKEELLTAVRDILGPDYDIDTHFTPDYRPWRQRVALVPDGDFFESIKSGQVSVETDEIETFTSTGVVLKSGAVLEADIVVAATGFNMNVLGDIDFSIDDQPLVFSDTVNYRGMMFTGIPNLLWVFGYFRGSWTVRADLLSDFVCRLLTHMDDKDAQRVEVKLRPEDEDMELLPWQDPENFNPGYLTRAMPLLPKSGAKPEWHHSQNLAEDLKVIPGIDLDGEEFVWG